VSILVTGANGNVSRAVVQHLTQAGVGPVRALVRDASRWNGPASVEVVEADLDVPATLGQAFEGIDTLWLLTAMGPQAPHASMNAVWAAKEAGVEHIVRMSAIGGAHDAPTRNGRLHALSDEELKRWEIPFTIVKPAFFMQNLYGSVQGDTMYGPLGFGRLAMIDVDDIGAFAATILADPPPHAGRSYTISGPASISLEQAAGIIGTETGTPVRYQPVTAEEAEQAMLHAGMTPWMAAVNAEYARAYSENWGDYTTPDFEKVMGRPARSFAQFAHDNLDRLRG
jgi:uncharacterized protein YbjT (DUF2867 family)